MRSKIVKGKIIPAGKLESDSKVESEASSCRQTGSKIAKAEVQCGLVAAKKVKVEKIDHGPAVKKLKEDIKSECKTVKKRTPGKKSSGQTSVRVERDKRLLKKPFQIPRAKFKRLCHAIVANLASDQDIQSSHKLSPEAWDTLHTAAESFISYEVFRQARFSRQTNNPKRKTTLLRDFKVALAIDGR